MTVAGSRVKHLPGVRVIPMKRKLMWAWGAVLGMLALAAAVGSVWARQASGRRAEKDGNAAVRRPRMERVSGGDAADRALLFARPERAGRPAPSLASDKNQEMDRLLNRRAIPADYAATMRALHGGAGQDGLTRNFAVQHLGLHVQELVRRGTYDPRAPEAARVRAVLDAAARATGSPVAGPALLALAELAAADPRVDAAGLDARLAACAGDAAASVPTRVIAVQLCGARRVRAARAALRAILADPSSGTVLRLSARRALALLE